MGNAVIGAHAMGFNTGSVGVSVIGNFVGVGPPAAALEAGATFVTSARGFARFRDLRVVAPA